VTGYKQFVSIACGLVFVASCSKKRDDNKGVDPRLGLRGEAALPEAWKEAIDPAKLPLLETARVETFSISGEAPEKMSGSYSLSDVSHQTLLSDGKGMSRNLSFILDLESRSWTSVPADPDLPLYATTKLALHENGILYWGGADSNGCGLSNGRYFDYESNSWQELPASDLSSRISPRTEFYKGEVLIFGGAARQPGKCPDLPPTTDFVKKDGQFYNIIEKKWGRKVQVPSGYMPSAIGGISTLISGDYFLVWTIGWNSAQISALDLTTDKWLPLASARPSEHPSSLQLSKTKDGFAIAQTEQRKNKEVQTANFTISFYDRSDIPNPRVIQTFLPAEFDHVQVEEDVEISASNGFVVTASGVAGSEFVWKRALILADADNPVLPLPKFGKSTPWWIAADGGLIGLSKGEADTIVAIYLDTTNRKFHKLPDIEAKLEDLRISRLYKGQTILLFEGSEKRGYSVKLR
jgi:hypothetical protein